MVLNKHYMQFYYEHLSFSDKGAWNEQGKRMFREKRS
jgi:hypothetical protein